MASDLPKLMENTTTSTAQTIQGRININQAPRPVLLCIPGMTADLADQIIAKRIEDPKDDSQDHQYETWPLSEGIVPLTTMKSMLPFVTAGGSVYRAQILGSFEGGGPTARLEVILDASNTPTKVLFWKDMSRLPTGFTVERPPAQPRRTTHEPAACLNSSHWNGTAMRYRVAAASAHGSRIVIDHAFLIPWNEDGTESDQAEDRVGQRIAEELDAAAESGVRRRWWRWAAAASNCVSFSSRPPPTKNCPIWSVFRRPGSSTNWTRSGCWISCRSTRGPRVPRTVLAMAIAPAVIRQIEGVCQRAGLKMQRLLLRPALRRRY